MVDSLVRVGFVAGLLAVFGVILYRSLIRSRELIERWARENGFVLRRCACHFGGRGWTLCIVDREGRTREGWARCGMPLIGILSDGVEVRWKKQPCIMPSRVRVGEEV